jgi:hypothetical protein
MSPCLLSLSLPEGTSYEVVRSCDFSSSSFDIVCGARQQCNKRVIVCQLTDLRESPHSSDLSCTIYLRATNPPYQHDMYRVINRYMSGRQLGPIRVLRGQHMPQPTTHFPSWEIPDLEKCGGCNWVYRPRDICSFINVPARSGACMHTCTFQKA